MKWMQRGFATELVIVGIITVIVAGALGYALWTKSTDSTKSQERAEGKTALAQPKKNLSTIETSMYDAKLRLSYPSGWTANDHKQTDAEAGVYEKIVISKPGSEVSVELSQTSDGQYGGACDPSDGPVVSSLECKPVDGLPGAIFTQVITQYDGVYALQASVMNDSTQLRELKVDQTACYLLLENLLKTDFTDERNMATIEIYVASLNGLNQKVDQITDRSVIDKVLASHDYKEAVEIARSLTLVKE